MDLVCDGLSVGAFLYWNLGMFSLKFASMCLACVDVCLCLRSAVEVRRGWGLGIKILLLSADSSVLKLESQPGLSVVLLGAVLVVVLLAAADFLLPLAAVGLPVASATT